MFNLKIEQISNQKADSISSEIAPVYARVFAGYPWYERTRCPITGPIQDENLKPGMSCTCCKTPQKLEVAYPAQETTQYIISELTMSRTIGLLGILDGPPNTYQDIVAFSWAFLSTPQDIANRKWRTDQARQAITQSLAQFAINGQLFFGSEMGVLPAYQDQNIGTQLMQARLERVNQAGLNLAGRTLISSPMSRIYETLGFSKLDVVDRDNPARALYIYQSGGK